eukprot:6327298-Amphidinium_carterae.1
MIRSESGISTGSHATQHHFEHHHQRNDAFAQLHKVKTTRLEEEKENAHSLGGWVCSPLRQWVTHGPIGS